jgi:hypothetical protein
MMHNKCCENVQAENVNKDEALVGPYVLSVERRSFLEAVRTCILSAEILAGEGTSRLATNVLPSIRRHIGGRHSVDYTPFNWNLLVLIVGISVASRI